MAFATAGHARRGFIEKHQLGIVHQGGREFRRRCIPPEYRLTRVAALGEPDKLEAPVRPLPQPLSGQSCSFRRPDVFLAGQVAVQGEGLGACPIWRRACVMSGEPMPSSVIEPASV